MYPEVCMRGYFYPLAHFLDKEVTYRRRQALNTFTITGFPRT